MPSCFKQCNVYMFSYYTSPGVELSFVQSTATVNYIYFYKQHCKVASSTLDEKLMFTILDLQRIFVTMVFLSSCPTKFLQAPFINIYLVSQTMSKKDKPPE